MIRVWRKMPKHILCQFGTSRAFKVQKRLELRVLLHALKTFRMGCAYVPDGVACAGEIESTLRRLSRHMSVEVWGR